MTIRKDFIDLLESSLAFCGQREFTHISYTATTLFVGLSQRTC